MLKDKRYLDLIAPSPSTGGEVHQENDFGKLLEPGLRKLFVDYLKEVPEQYSRFYNMKTSKKAKETDYGVGAFKEWTQFGKAGTTVADGTAMPEVEYQKIHPGLERTYVHEEFASGFKVERKFIDDEQYDVINKLPKMLAKAGRAKVEKDASSFFNDALKATGSANIYDGKPLFSHEHPLIERTDIKGDNLIDGTLSKETLEKALLLADRQVDEAGNLCVMNFDTIVVPPELENTARILLQTTGEVGSNNNDINVVKGKLKIEVWKYLTKADACYIMDSNGHEANFFWRVKPEFNREKEFDTFVQKYNGYMRYSFGVSDWRGLIAIKPSTTP